MLELWKPYMWLEDKNKSLIFNEVEQFYIPKYKSIRPFVIFYDDQEDCYYYLKARTANIKFPNKKLEEEVLIPRNVKFDLLPSYQGVLINDSWIDCSQIFKIDANLLESLVDVDNQIHKNTPKIEKKYISKILDKMNECIFKSPPNLSILEIKLNENNETFAESLYLSSKKLQQAIIKLDDDIYPWETIRDINDFISSPDAEFSYQRERYMNGINFCLMFLKAYFPDKVNEFVKVQKINFDQRIINEEKYFLSFKIFKETYKINSVFDFQDIIDEYDLDDLEYVEIVESNSADLYDLCVEYLERRINKIKNRDRGGDGGMSM